MVGSKRYPLACDPTRATPPPRVFPPVSIRPPSRAPTRSSLLCTAYGGQFAFVELIVSMKEPRRFSSAVTLCTAIMTTLYGGFGAVGYWSKGSSVHGIVIFNMAPGTAAQIAAAFIFFQVCPGTALERKSARRGDLYGSNYRARGHLRRDLEARRPNGYPAGQCRGSPPWDEWGGYSLRRVGWASVIRLTDSCQRWLPCLSSVARGEPSRATRK